MTAVAVLVGLVLALVFWRIRRRKAARSVAADGVSLALASLAPRSTVPRHRAPRTRAWLRGSGGAM